MKHFHLGKSAVTGLVPPAGMTSVLSLQVVFAVRRDNTKDLKNFEDFDIGSLTSTGYTVETDITEDLK